MANRFLVGTTWNAAGNWSTTSGGAGGAGVPTGSDDVFCDANSPSCGIDVNAVCLSLDSTGYTNTLTQEATFTLTVGSGNFLWAAGTFAGDNSTIDINGDFTLSGGTFTNTSGTMTVEDDFTISGGTYANNSGRITFDTAGTHTVDIGTEIFNNVTIDIGGFTLVVTGTMDVDGDLTITNAGAIGTGTIAVAGDVIPTDIRVDGTGTILFDGTGAQTLKVDGAGGTGGLSNFDINKASGTLTILDNINIEANWTHTAGTIDAGTSTINFNGPTTGTVNDSVTAFNNVIIDRTTFTLVITGTMDINGDLTITSVASINTGTITLAGNLTSNDTVVSGTALITLDGTGAQTINGGTGRFPKGTFTINKASGGVTLLAAFVLDATGQDLIVTSGMFDLNGFNLTVDDLFTVTDTLVLKGNETITVGTLTLDQAASTVAFKDSAITATIDALATAFFNLTLGASKTHNITAGVGNGIEVKGSFASNGIQSTRSILRSTVGGTQAELNLSGTSALTNNVDVKDSDASAGNEVQASGSLDSGNNTNWNFAVVAAKTGGRLGIIGIIDE